MCHPRGIQSSKATTGFGSACCGHGPFLRRFISAQEELECLEEYRDQLKKELAGVEEHIQKMKGK